MTRALLEAGEAAAARLSVDQGQTFMAALRDRLATARRAVGAANSGDLERLEVAELVDATLPQPARRAFHERLTELEGNDRANDEAGGVAGGSATIAMQMQRARRRRES
jgi:hypothetical protein